MDSIGIYTITEQKKNLLDEVKKSSLSSLNNFNDF